MGIQGLLQFIKEAAEPTHVKKYRGQAVAVDTYCWLHKGAYACAEKLARGEPTDFYVAFCMKLVDMLLSFEIKPVLVFDGCTLPSKKEVEKARRERRQANLLKGKQLLQEGRLSEARECFGRSINVTHAMARDVIKAARARGVDCIVAPYEADAQLAYLNKTGMVQAIITEDSDLLAFGCKKVFLKIDKFGNGLEIDQARLGNCKQLGNVFTEEKFRYMCILSGCDYLSSMHGIGLAKACKLLKLANNPDIIKVIKKMGQYLKMNITVPEEYIQGFTRANNTFLYQLVFDPVNRKLIPLNAYGDDVDPETLIYAGRHFGDGTAFQIAIGNVDVDTMEQVDNYNPDTAKVIFPVQQRCCSWNDRRADHVNSIWSRDYKLNPSAETVPYKVHLLEKPTTKGMEKIISVKGLKLPSKDLLAKRPRSDVEEISDGDLLNQYSYSYSKAKKLKSDHDAEAQQSVTTIQSLESSGNSVTPESSKFLPKARNKFASFLQRKNKVKDAVIVPGTRSRFFCSDAIFDARSKKNDSDLTEDDGPDCQKQELKHTPDVSHVPESEKSRSSLCISPGEKQKNCFGWFNRLVNNSGTLTPSPTVFSQLSHQPRSSCDVSRNGNRAQKESGTVSGELKEESSLLTELEQSSQSCETSESSLETSEIPEMSNNTSDAEVRKLDLLSCSPSELLCALLYALQRCTCYLHVLFNHLCHTINISQVPGLHKTTCLGSHIVTKLKPLIPAKVSGLSRKLSPVQKRNHCDAENKLGLQDTISELRKNFQFKRDYEKLPSCKKSDPLSPIKDNIQLTPETEEEIFNHLEWNHVQRAIFQ
ncbi:EXO1 Exonuclease, partial [Upupa epops]|nr:EXO1 Exonuclease [Upupa epops]